MGKISDTDRALNGPSPPFWERCLPRRIRSKLEHRPNLQKIFDNISWLFLEKILRLGVTFIVGIWLARYLGPERFGLLNFALAFVAIFGTFAALGLQNIVVLQLVQRRSSEGMILGTAFAVRLLAGCVSFVALAILIFYMQPDEMLTKAAVVILGISIVFKATDVVKNWFEANVQSKYVVWAENSIFVAVSAVKIALITFNAPLISFVVIILLESIFAAVGLLIIYFWHGEGFRTWRVGLETAVNLVRESWPLLFSGVAVIIFTRIDQIMLGQMLGNSAVGVYSVAVRITEVSFFLPSILLASIFPSIIEARSRAPELYQQRIQTLFDLMVLYGFAIALPTTFIADWIVTVLFTEAYADAGAVLSIQIWGVVFVFLGGASGKWFVVEGLQMLALQRALLGVVTNVILNLLLIPTFEVKGAVFATIFTLFVVAIFSDLINKKTRALLLMKMKALNIFGSFHRMLSMTKSN